MVPKLLVQPSKHQSLALRSRVVLAAQGVDSTVVEGKLSRDSDRLIYRSVSQPETEQYVHA